MRRKSDGAIEVLLVTSRDTGRWIIPKGWPWPDRASHEAAAGEAHEEAGAVGAIETDRFGTYLYDKRQEDGTLQLSVDVYLLWVETTLSDWPERGERKRAWYAPADAAKVVDEPELSALLRAVAERLPALKSR